MTLTRRSQASLSAVLFWAFVGSGAPAFAQRPAAAAGRPNSFTQRYKLDEVVAGRARGNALLKSSVLVALAPGAELPPAFRGYVGGGALDIINAVQLNDLPNGLLRQLADSPAVAHVHDNRPALLHNYRTAVTVGARAVQETLGLTGLGIGVAVIDSGISAFHDDLTRGGGNSTRYPYGDQRVLKFVDFVGGRTLPYDDHGHGSHVAGTIAGNGYDSRGDKAGIAPNASLVVLKVLDATGAGTIGNIIAALNWVAQNAKSYNIRVVNMSVGAAVRESYWTDPLTLAVKAVTDRGVVVVAAAGNLGRNAKGQTQYGGITAPGNAPWALTVGASSTEGTLTRNDDVMAGYSSRGPTFLDWNAKPDLVAPGSGTVSLAAPGSTIYSTQSQYLVNGTVSTASMPYVALSGTSMSAPVVAGTVALMLQANPKLTPNLVKAILQYTAQRYPNYNRLTEGAGFLNSLGAVQLANFYAGAHAGDRVPVQKTWSREIIWGNHRITGGIMVPSANAWGNNIVWGTATTGGVSGENIVWGTSVGPNIVWGTGTFDNIVWGTNGGANIVWGTTVGDNIVWGTNFSDNIVWGTSMIDRDNIVWGTWAGENIVWGTACGGADCDHTVWGSMALDNIVWGTASLDNIVWGTVSLDNIVWGTLSLDNIVWGTWAVDNIVWGTSFGDNIVWGTSSSPDTTMFPDDANGPVPNIQEELGAGIALRGGL